MDHPFSMSLNPMTALKDVKYATSVSTLYNLTLACVVVAFRLAHVSILSLGQKQSALSSSTFIFKRL